MTNIKKNNIIELFIASYFILGSIEKIGMVVIPYTAYIISIGLQIVVIMYIVLSEKYKMVKKPLILYLINLSIIVIITLNFLYLDTSLLNIINRILPLISIFGFVIIFAVDSYNFIDFNKVLEKVIYGYAFIGIIIGLDAISFCLFKVSVWPPDYYLGARFSGPFFDSNFLGLFYGVFLIIIMFYKKITVKHKSLIISIFAINFILSLSWTSILFFMVAITLNRVIKFKNIFLKQILMIVAYTIIIYIFSQNYKNYEIIFINTLSDILPFSESELSAKFLSLEYRVSTQIKSLDIVKNNLMGMGPRTIVPLLGRDTHNSYFAFLFELGIPGFLLLLINVWIHPKKYSKFLDILSTYIFLMSFTLNVHYKVIYMLFISLLVTEYFSEKRLSISNVHNY